MMNIQKLTMVAFVTAMSAVNICHADETDENSGAFTKQYLSTCMQNINDIEALRTRLTNNKLPKFPPEQAALFLQGREGDAWPVPVQGQVGNLVLALPAGKNLCILYARRANQNDVERQFVRLVEKAPSPLVSERRADEIAETSLNGKAHTIAYAWLLPQANRKILFMLTTASSENAQLQVLGSVSIIQD